MKHVSRSLRIRGAGLALALIAIGIPTALSATAGASTQSAPSNTSPPTISGTAQEGQTLKADPGTWSGSTPIDYSYQWRRCGTGGASCSNISGATDNIYTVSAADVGHRLRVLVTAVNNDGASTAQSAATAVVSQPDAGDASSIGTASFPPQ